MSNKEPEIGNGIKLTQNKLQFYRFKFGFSFSTLPCTLDTLPPGGGRAPDKKSVQ